MLSCIFDHSMLVIAEVEVCRVNNFLPMNLRSNMQVWPLVQPMAILEAVGLKGEKSRQVIWEEEDFLW